MDMVLGVMLRAPPRAQRQYHEAEAIAIAGARRELNSKPEARTKPAERSAAPGPSKYTDLEALLTFALSGDVQFVKASYYLALKRQGRIFPRRQDLPPEACASAADVRRWGDEIRATLALRKKYTEGVGVEEIQHGARFPPFVVASYAWLSPEHPDPDGRQLGEVLAPAIEWYMSERAKYIKGEVHAVKRAAAGDEAKLAAPFTSDGVDFGIFLDFTSIWQKERTQQQQAAFDRALQAMDLLYAHQETTVWRMTRLLDGYPNAKPYSDRGWPFFETSAAQYIKPPWLTLDLGSQKAVKALSKFKGVARAPEELAKRGMPIRAGGDTYWHHTGNPGLIAALKDRRLPPLVPDEFAARAEPKALTNGKDKQVLLDLQRAVSTTVLAGVQEMSFSRLGWGDDDAALLAKALSLCHGLCTLNLSGNAIGAAGAVALAPSIAASASLTEVDLGGNKLGDEGWCAIFDALRDNPQNKISKWDVAGQGINPTIAKSLAAYMAVSASLTEVNLFGNKLGPEGATALAPALAANASLTAIDVSGNNIDQPSSRLILDAMRGKNMQSIGMAKCNLGVEEAKILAEYVRAMASLTSLRLDDNRLCGVWYDEGWQGTYDATGINAIADALRVNASLTEVDLRGNNLGEEGWCAIFDALRHNPQNKIAKWNLNSQDINPTISKSLAAYMAVSASLTSVSLAFNTLGDDGAKALAAGLRENKTLKKLDVSSGRRTTNGITAEGRAALEEAVSGKEGFELIFSKRSPFSLN